MKLFQSRSAIAKQQPNEDVPALKAPSFAMDVIHLYVLSAFAVSQPLLDRLAHQATFLIRQQIDSRGLLLTVATVMLAVPSAMSLIESLVGLSCGARARRRLHRCFLFALLLGFLLQIQLITVKTLNGEAWGIPGFVMVGIAAGVAMVVCRAIESSMHVRKAIAYAAVGIVLFPIMFCRKPGVREIVFPPMASETNRVDNPTPIVMVIFDGLNGMALLDEHYEIDAVRYPNFARLATMSHWFRNATTVHPRTGYAVPAILTGCLPRDVIPVYGEYPNNLLQFIHQSHQYEMSVFEPSTQLAPLDIARPLEPHSPQRQAGFVLWHLGFVFVHATLPADVFPGRPEIPRTWFNLSEEIQVPDYNDTTGSFAYSWDVQRRVQFEHFLNCIRVGEQPGFRFLHLVIPHHPWHYLPDGRCYAPRLDVGDFPLGTHGDIGEDWTSDALVVNLARQRYLLQLMYVDHLIGQLLDKLDSTGLLDECLLVVTADHGEAFLPGTSRREITGENISEVLPIPLFIKLPHQNEGIVSDRNVESIDIFPTIADVIGLELRHEVDGRAIFDPEQPPPLRKTFLSHWEPLAVTAEFPERYRSVDRMIELFGSGSNDDRLWSYSFLPELVGQPLSAFRIEEEDATEIELFHNAGQFDNSKPDVVPCLFEGRVTGFPSGEPPITLVVALNGRIEAVTRTIDDELQSDFFTVLAPQAVFQQGDNDLRIFKLINSESGAVLQQCVVRHVPT